MHMASTEYNIRCQNYLNNCKGDDEAIPVTVMLVSMYNACYAFQNDNRKNLLILALQRLDHGGGAISDNAFIHTFSEYKKLFSSLMTLLNLLLTNFQILYQLYGNFSNSEKFQHNTYCWDQIACHGTSVMLHSLLPSTLLKKKGQQKNR
jgi:hypothetical protein